MCALPVYYCVWALEECSLTATVSGLPLQTLAVGEGDDVSIWIHTAPVAAAPHALHGLAGAVGTGGPQGTGHLTGAHAEVWAHWESQGSVFWGSWNKQHGVKLYRNIKEKSITIESSFGLCFWFMVTNKGAVTLKQGKHRQDHSRHSYILYNFYI